MRMPFLFSGHKARMMTPEEALPGREEPMPVPARHFVNGHRLEPPFPQGMRQGNDVGTQYRSAVYTYGELQEKSALASRDAYADRLRAAGYDEITTEIREAPAFYYAEDYHQQYLAKNPHGYCPDHSTGV